MWIKEMCDYHSYGNHTFLIILATEPFKLQTGKFIAQLASSPQVLFLHRQVQQQAL